jgi:DNA (cytosine-5)-methyltransferase 1
MSEKIKYTAPAASRLPKASSKKDEKISDYAGFVAELLDAATRFQKLDRWKSELPAAATHWLLSGGEASGFLGADFRSAWNDFTTSYGIDGYQHRVMEGGQLVLPFGITLGGIPFPPPEEPQFSFIDLFAGIGGFRIALQKHGGRCVFSSEWDRAAQETYFNNFGEYPFGDIRQFTGEGVSDQHIKRLIPDHDVLAAGFPCQPFSHAGVSARRSLGRKHGFECNTQGTLFFDLVRIAKAKRPKVLFLENVRSLKTHDEGRTFETIKRTIEDDLGYSFHYSIVDASSTVPQKRKRCFMVCFRETKTPFEFPDFSGDPIPLKSILEKKTSDWFTLSDKMWQGHIRRTQRNLDRGAGFTAYEADLDKPANTLVSRYWKDGKECLIPQKGLNPRLLTPRECARLQGYPESFRLPTSPNAAYRQFGNSVVVPVVGRIAAAILKALKIKL